MEDTFTNDNNMPLTLVVEDNQDVKEYLIACLGSKYQLAFAENGTEGIEKAIQLIPDLIISDVMMPEKDGFELTESSNSYCYF